MHALDLFAVGLVDDAIEIATDPFQLTSHTTTHRKPSRIENRPRTRKLKNKFCSNEPLDLGILSWAGRWTVGQGALRVLDETRPVHVLQGCIDHQVIGYLH